MKTKAGKLLWWSTLVSLGGGLVCSFAGLGPNHSGLFCFGGALIIEGILDIVVLTVMKSDETGTSLF
jgi:hypothetical protein